MDLSTKGRNDATQNPTMDNNLLVQIDLKRLNDMPALENAINKSRDKSVSIAPNTTPDRKGSVAKNSAKETEKTEVKAKLPPNFDPEDKTISIKHNLPVIAMPEREKYKIPKPKDVVPPIVIERCSVEIQTDEVILCSKEDHDILQFIRSNGITFDALTRLITTNDVNNNSNRQSNYESSNTIIIDLANDGDDETDNEIINTVISKSNTNKTLLLNKLYGSVNKETAETVAEDNSLLENKNNKILVMTKLCTALLGKIAAYTMLSSPHKTFCDKDTQTDNANKKRKTSTSADKTTDKLFGEISAEELLQLDAEGMRQFVENKILRTQLLQQQGQQANYYQQPIQEPEHQNTAHQKLDIRPPYIPQMMPRIPVMQTSQMRPNCPPSRYPIGGSMYNPDGIQSYPNRYAEIFARSKNPAQIRHTAQHHQRQPRKFFPNQMGVGAIPLLPTSSFPTENAHFEQQQHQQHQQQQHQQHQQQQHQQQQQQLQQQYNQQMPVMMDQHRLQQMELQKNAWESQLLNYPNSAWSRSVREAHSI